MVKGYQDHEVINDRESVWRMKAQFGSFSRTSKFHTTITEWVPNERVAFEMKGINEPVTGSGVVKLSHGAGADNTALWAEVGFHADGALGPLIDRMVKPLVRSIAEELVKKLVAAVRPPQSPTENETKEPGAQPASTDLQTN